MLSKHLLERSCLFFGMALFATYVLAQTTEPSQQNPANVLSHPKWESYSKTAEPILQKYCYGCHGTGKDSGKLSFPALAANDDIRNPELWLKVLKNIRAGLMPPSDELALQPGEKEELEHWIKTVGFGLDPQKLHPGRVTLRRLNRIEYQNAIRDLIGYEVDIEQMLPPDDVGYGFDNIGDVLNLSPTRLEKFLETAIAVVDKGVPQDTVTIPSVTFMPEDFVDEKGRNGDHMSFYQDRTVRKIFTANAEGDYLIHIYCKIDGDAAPRDPQECRIHVTSDGYEFFTRQYQWADNEWFEDDCIVHMEPGKHEIAFRTEVVHPELKPLRSKMEYRIVSVRVDGPLDRSKWTNPPGYEKIYSRAAPPTDSGQRRDYATEVLGRFATRAYRRPVSEATLHNLVTIAEETYSLPDKTFEQGIAQAIVGILASPKFLFQFEEALPTSDGKGVVALDEFSLASRLSFTLWRSIPDDELMELAKSGKLRENLRIQIKRMLADPKSKAFVQGFSHQWLQTAVVSDIPINSQAIMALEPEVKQSTEESNTSRNAGPGASPFGNGPPGFGRFGRRAPRPYTGTELTPTVRAAMKQEVELHFDHVMRENRSVLEFLYSDYIFVNSDLAKLYGIPEIEGNELRKVQLPDSSPRGGVLTMGSVLTVTSNPTRTSPVKRGKWILENILGAPTAPPPPDVPALEDTTSKTNKKPTQREALAIHRADPLCASCHARMDPMGLALENFNGFGRFRTIELDQPVDPAGELITGESFGNVLEFKKTLVENHRMEFYRNLVGKLLTYTLGRGTEFYDTLAIDQIADQMEQSGGRFESLIMGVLESTPVHFRNHSASIK